MMRETIGSMHFLSYTYFNASTADRVFRDGVLETRSHLEMAFPHRYSA